MAAYSSSSGSRRYDVFPSFSGEDVRKGFLSHLLMAFERRSINSFIDNKIERSCEIGPELTLAIKEARIAIVIFSKNYASSKWCLDELAEIHNCYKELNQKVIPIFYNVDPSEVRKQKGEFGESFMKTCEEKSDDVKQRWKQALTDVANIAGEHLSNGKALSQSEIVLTEVSYHDLLNQSIGFHEDIEIQMIVAICRRFFLPSNSMSGNQEPILVKEESVVGIPTPLLELKSWQWWVFCIPQQLLPYCWSSCYVSQIEKGKQNVKEN